MPSADKEIPVNGRKPWQWVVFLLPVVALGFYAALKSFAPDLYWSINMEDRFTETVQIVLCLSAAVVAAIVAVGFFKRGVTLYGILYGCFSAGLLLIFFEEIRWGQDLLQVALPDYFRAKNVQQEISFHNLDSTRAIVREISVYVGFLCAFSWLVLPRKVRSINPVMVEYLLPGRLLLLYFLPFFAFYFYLTFVSGLLVRLTSINAFHVGYAFQDYPLHFIDQEPAELLLFAGFLAFAIVARLRQKSPGGVEQLGSGRLVVAVAVFALLLMMPFHFAYSLIARDIYPYDYVDFGTNAYEMGDVPAAIEYYQKALLIDPLHSETHNNLGNVLMGQGELQSAATHLAEAVRIHPESAEKQYDLALAMLRLNKPDEAVKGFSQAIRINPEYEEAYLGLADSQLKAGDVDGVVVTLEDYLTINPENVKVRNRLANQLVSQQRYSDAVEQYVEILKISPGSYEAHYNLGSVLMNLGNQDEAAVHFVESLRLNPVNTLAYNNLGNLLARAGQFDQARVHYLKAIQYDPSFVDAHYNLGVVLLRLDEQGLAERQFNQVLMLMPQHEKARRYLERLRQENPTLVRPSS